MAGYFRIWDFSRTFSQLQTNTGRTKLRFHTNWPQLMQISLEMLATQSVSFLVFHWLMGIGHWSCLPNFQKIPQEGNLVSINCQIFIDRRDLDLQHEHCLLGNCSLYLP
jgi:hypothetical protein